ncbi:unnamed protein product [Schistosoma margrebowiei]|uniref:Uncharacterized protein n=1 Tax=Schistosoma margrebowiei TaxID=48269 RepID=A0A183LH40_9TREM|nr:unnamed protein product [Schistosoma margrebowiei]
MSDSKSGTAHIHIRYHNPQTGHNEAEELLVESYQGAIEFLFELGTWLTYIGKIFPEYFVLVRLDEDAQSTRNIIESVVKEAILQNYDRSKAITCLTDEASAWLSQMVESPTWRQTIYNLAQHPRNEDCPFLSLSMPCIAVKESLIGELVSVPLAWNTLGIFLKCVIYVLQPLLAAGDTVKDQTFMYSIAFLQPKRNNASCTNYSSVSHSEMSMVNSESLPSIDDVKGFVSAVDNEHQPYSSEGESHFSFDTAQDMLTHFLEMGCHSEHGYLLLQSILQCLARKMKSHCAHHLIWLLEAEASRRNAVLNLPILAFTSASDPPCSSMMLSSLSPMGFSYPENSQVVSFHFRSHLIGPSGLHLSLNIPCICINFCCGC